MQINNSTNQPNFGMSMRTMGPTIKGRKLVTLFHGETFLWRQEPPKSIFTVFMPNSKTSGNKGQTIDSKITIICKKSVLRGLHQIKANILRIGKKVEMPSSNTESNSFHIGSGSIIGNNTIKSKNPIINPTITLDNVLTGNNEIHNANLLIRNKALTGENSVTGGSINISGAKTQTHNNTVAGHDVSITVEDKASTFNNTAIGDDVSILVKNKAETYNNTAKGHEAHISIKDNSIANKNEVSGKNALISVDATSTTKENIAVNGKNAQILIKDF